MKTFTSLIIIFFATLVIPVTMAAQSSPDGSEAIGRWNITLEKNDGDHPAWLEVKRSGFSRMVGYYVGYEGSVRPVSEIRYSGNDGKYYFSIPPQWKDMEDDLHFEFGLKDNALTGTIEMGSETVNWTAVRAPDLRRDSPPVWGEPESLLDESMSRWIIPANNRFRMVDGILVNERVGGNLVTKETFDDFKLHVEFRYPEGSNSGIYLRGRYEVQIMDNYGEDPSNLIIGGVYGFIEPSVNAAKAAGQWQTLDITLVGRHVTVVLNGKMIISNRPIPGITGGALDGDEGQPGPLMLQGDHGPVDFRKIVITPSIK